MCRWRTMPPGGAFGAVTETLPAGFGCASSDLDDEEVQAAGQ